MSELTFDIFLSIPKDAIWLEAVEGLADARRRMDERAAARPGQYFLFSEGSIVAKVDTRDSAAASPKHLEPRE